MKTQLFKTNINCNGCVAKISPLLNKEIGPENWKVDIEHPNKLLTISKGNLSENEVVHLIDEAGFMADIYQPSGDSDQYTLDTENKPSIDYDFWHDTVVWRKASKNTVNCLVGCSIGDFGMMIFLQTYYHHLSMALMMALAMAAGIGTSIALETAILKFKEGFTWKNSFTTAINMSLISMVAMELAENATDLAVTGGNLPATDPAYWYALIPSVTMGFLVPLPYNYYRLKKHGKSCH